jgi:transcription elongation factor
MLLDAEEDSKLVRLCESVEADIHCQDYDEEDAAFQPGPIYEGAARTEAGVVEISPGVYVIVYDVYLYCIPCIGLDV